MNTEFSLKNLIFSLCFIAISLFLFAFLTLNAQYSWAEEKEGLKLNRSLINKFLKNAEYDKVESFLKKYIEEAKKSQDLPSYYFYLKELGKLYYKIGKYKESVQKLNICLVGKKYFSKEEIQEIYFYLGKNFEDSLIFPNALSFFYLVFNQSQKYKLDATFEISDILYRLGFTKKSILFLKNNLLKFSDSERKRIWAKIGDLNYKSFQFKEAFQAYTNATNAHISPEGLRVLTQKKLFCLLQSGEKNYGVLKNFITSELDEALILYWIQAYSDALDRFQKLEKKISIFTLEKDKFAIYLALGLLYFKRNEIDLAEKNFKKAIFAVERLRYARTLGSRINFFHETTNTFDHSLPYFALINVYQINGDYLRAIAISEKIKTRIFTDYLVKSFNNPYLTYFTINEYILKCGVKCDHVIFGKLIPKLGTTEFYGPSFLSMLSFTIKEEFKYDYKSVDEAKKHIKTILSSVNINSEIVESIFNKIKKIKEMGYENSLTSIMEKQH